MLGLPVSVLLDSVGGGILLGLCWIAMSFALAIRHAGPSTRPYPFHCHLNSCPNADNWWEPRNPDYETRLVITWLSCRKSVLSRYPPVAVGNMTALLCAAADPQMETGDSIVTTDGAAIQFQHHQSSALAVCCRQP